MWRRDLEYAVRHMEKERNWDTSPSVSQGSQPSPVALLRICIRYKHLYTRLSSNLTFWFSVTDDFHAASGWHEERVRSFVQKKLSEYRYRDHTVRPVDPDGYRMESLLWEMMEHISFIKWRSELRRSDYRYRSPTPLPQSDLDMTWQDVEEAILERVKSAAMRCDFDQAKWLLLQFKDNQKPESYIKEFESNKSLHEQIEKQREMESAKAESDGEWEKAKSSLLSMENKVRSGRLLVALERRQAIQNKYNRSLQEETVLAQFVDRDLTKACDLVSLMKGKRPKALVALFKCNEALAKGDFSGAKSILSDPQLASVHMALEPIVDLAEALHNEDQDKATSLSLRLKVDGENFGRILLNSSAGVSTERCDGHVEVVSLLQPEEPLSDADIEFQKRSKEESLCGDWNEAKRLLLLIPKKTVSGPLLRKLEAERSAFYEADKDLEKQAKEAEMKGDWEGAKSLLSRIKSDFGKFLLAALAYSEARLTHKDEHMEILVQLQKKYPDARLEQVKFTQYFEHAERNGPPERATDLHSLFVGEKMFGTGVLWSEPDDFRKVFEMMAEDMRDTYDRAWYCLPAPTMRSPTASRSQAGEGHIAENPPSETTQVEPRGCPGTSPSSSSLPAIPRDPCIMTPNWTVIREYQRDRPELPSLSLDQQLVLFQICIVHKSRYTKSQGNLDFWHRVADQFWEVSGWHWKRVRTLVQTKLRSQASCDRGPQLAPLIDELRSHIHAISHPNRSNMAQSSSRSPVVQGQAGRLSGQSYVNELPKIPVEIILAQGAAKRTFSQTGFDVEISSDGMLYHCCGVLLGHTNMLSLSTDDLPTHHASRPRHNGPASVPASSSVSIHTQPLVTTESAQDLIAKIQEAKEQYDYDKAKSLLLQIPDKKILEPLLKALDVCRETQIRTNKELEKQSKEAELKEDWAMAKSKLSSIKGEDPSFLLSALQFSRIRISWAYEELDPCDLIDQIIKDYSDPRLEQVRLDNELSDAEMSGNPQRIGHYRGLLRANQRRIGVLWEKPDDFRKVFQIMAAEMRGARDKVWYANPARAKPTGFQSNSDDDAGSGSAPGLGWKPRPQPRSRRPDIDKELNLLDKARAELIKGYDKAKAILRKGSSEDNKEAIKALECSA